MLYAIAMVLLIAWLLGIVGTYTIGAFVHVLLVIALVLFVVGDSTTPAIGDRPAVDFSIGTTANRVRALGSSGRWARSWQS
jgi:Family of unknown function (DUF5670)